MPPNRAWADHATSSLGAAGYRGGAARAAVVEYLATQSCCRTAVEIHSAVGGSRSVGLASVYRALDVLTQLRVVQRVEVGDGVARFEPAVPGGEHHHHLVCDDCGKVEAFEDHGLEQALGKVAASTGYALDGHEVLLRGACGDCRSSSTNTPGYDLERLGDP